MSIYVHQVFICSCICIYIFIMEMPTGACHSEQMEIGAGWRDAGTWGSTWPSLTPPGASPPRYTEHPNSSMHILCICIRVYIYIHIYMYVYVCIHIHYVYIYIFICISHHRNHEPWNFLRGLGNPETFGGFREPCSVVVGLGFTMMDCVWWTHGLIRARAVLASSSLLLSSLELSDTKVCEP